MEVRLLLFMRVDPHTLGSVLHVMKRGARGMEIVRDASDKKHFLKCLFYLNDTHQDQNWRQNLTNAERFERPKHWPERKPLVDVWAWTLMPNHFHLIVRERTENGLSLFMQRLGGSMSARFNAKYKERGSIFQGAYKGRTVTEDADLRWLASYVMVKNTLELYPGGLAKAVTHLKKAWLWGIEYPFSSMGIYAGAHSSPIIETKDNLLQKLFKSPEHFKTDSFDMVRGFVEKRARDSDPSLTLE